MTGSDASTATAVCIDAKTKNKWQWTATPLHRIVTASQKSSCPKSSFGRFSQCSQRLKSVLACTVSPPLPVRSSQYLRPSASQSAWGGIARAQLLPTVPIMPSPGLNRHLFLPFIDCLRDHCDVVAMARPPRPPRAPRSRACAQLSARAQHSSQSATRACVQANTRDFRRDEARRIPPPRVLLRLFPVRPYLLERVPGGRCAQALVLASPCAK